jgi:hypothetical protein
MSAPFLNSQRYGTDACAKECRDIQNDGIYGWNMYPNFVKDCAPPGGREPEFQYEHPNLRTSHIGYGVADSCLVDTYSQLRTAPTRGRCHLQLFERIFQGVPNLRPGVVDPAVEAQIVQGTSTSALEGAEYECRRAINPDFEFHLTPLVPCMKDIQDPEHIVERGWTRGGDDTRSFVRRQEFLKACGKEYMQKQRSTAGYA